MRDAQITKIIDWTLDGLMTTAEALKQLDAFQVRGNFNRLGFTGYDYHDQQWIER